jgi:hypothetical protein
MKIKVPMPRVATQVPNLAGPAPPPDRVFGGGAQPLPIPGNSARDAILQELQQRLRGLKKHA